MIRPSSAVLLFFLGFTALTLEAKPLLGGAKSIAVGADGTVPGSVASPMMAQGSYLKGATKVAVPLIAVAFESFAEAKISSAGREFSST